jgi:polyisoprenoid-binding protein YceI
MTTAQETKASIPTGVWKSDPVHTHIGFEVNHAGATFKGDFDEFDATLDNTGEETKLSGSVPVASLKVRDEQLQGHLASPDFFDTARYPEIRFESTSVRVEGDKFVVEGELSIKDVKKSVAAEGSVAQQSTYLDGKEHVGIDLETKIDRTDYGVNWNAELPSGGNAVGDEVTLTVHLELIKED